MIVVPLCGTAAPFPSAICTAGWVESGTPLVAAEAGWVSRTSLAAAGAVTSMVPDVTPVRPVALNRRVRGPGDPVMRRSVKTACPLAPVVRVVVPPRVPPPLAMATVTAMPLCETASPEASRSWTTGCRESGSPLTAVAAGWVVSESDAAGPGPAALTTMLPEVTGESDPDSKRRV